MRLKEIKPGMVIHCKTNDESKALYDELCRIGNMKTDTVTDSLDNFKDTDCCYRIEDLKHETWSFATGPATVEFADLIIPDPELSAEEALLAYDQMCMENHCCNDCPIYGIFGHECPHAMDGHITEIMDAIKEWKAEHEKKEPEIETVDICRIIENQPDGRKRCVHEEDIIPDPDLSAEEALLAYDQMCMENYCCNDCPIYGILGRKCAHAMEGHITEIMDAIKEWKADHEKKEPEIEWFWKSYVVGGSDYKEADTEQEAMEWCEYYEKEHPEAKCTYKHVCRVKAVK